MDIDEFLDRELSDLGLQSEKTEKQEIDVAFQEQSSSPLFENIKSNLTRGNLEIAEQSYVQLWHMLSQQKLKWNRELYEQLLAASRQFSGALGSAFNEVRKKAEHINELIARARAALREGRKDTPFKFFSEIEEISNSIPNVFFEEKRVIEEQAMDFYKELKGTTDNELLKRVSALVNETSRLIDRINLAIRANDIVNATVNYHKCIELYNQVPEGFLKYKNSLGARLLDIYMHLSITTEITNLQNQLSQQPPIQQPVSFRHTSRSLAAEPKPVLLSERKERAKRHIEKGFYNEALKSIQEALDIDPNDAEAKAIHAKIKTLQ